MKVEFEWTDELAKEFAGISCGGSYGIYKHCKTKQQKLEVFKKEVIDRVRIKDLPKSCCLCEEEFHGFGNNAQPLKDGVCCDSCNTEVIMARLKTIL
mgnify:CR=1 FL=1|tara:strand:- start:157 stop:447 length:291 start_codon:yes stop_codon:yes gene_type:complete